jgi:hypothetical protein
MYKTKNRVKCKLEEIIPINKKPPEQHNTDKTTPLKHNTLKRNNITKDQTKQTPTTIMSTSTRQEKFEDTKGVI